MKLSAEHLAPGKHPMKGSYRNYDYASRVSAEGSPELKAFCLIPFPHQMAPFFSPRFCSTGAARGLLHKPQCIFEVSS